MKSSWGGNAISESINLMREGLGNGCSGKPFFQDCSEAWLDACESETHCLRRSEICDGRGSFEKIGVAVDFDRNAGTHRERVGCLHATAVQAEVRHLRGAAGVLFVVNDFG